MGNKIIGCALLLGILIFLPEPGDGLAEFGESCHVNRECKTHWCHEKKCLCPSRNKGRHNVLVQFFDKAKEKCVSAVGKACTLQRNPDDVLPPLECVEHAICRPRPRHSRISDTIGECICRDEYKMTPDHLCVLPHQFGTAEEQVDNGNGKFIIGPKKEEDTTWSTVSNTSFSVSINNESYSLIGFIIPIFTLLMRYLCSR